LCATGGTPPQLYHLRHIRVSILAGKHGFFY
jgi:hypothetical protein